MNSIKDIAIVDYLTLKGFVFKRQGSRYFTNSPFNKEDNTPSFCVFPDNGFKCFSTGKAGNIETLTKFFGDDLTDIAKIQRTWVAPDPVAKRPWKGKIPETFLKLTIKELALVETYAKSRRIHTGYQPGRFFVNSGTKFVPHLAMLFPHVDRNLFLTGGKFRVVQPIGSQRFSSSGVLGFYILENIIPEHYATPEFWLVESETSANSLWEFCKLTQRNVVICSCGAVSVAPKLLPDKYVGMKGRVLIDYDGSEEQYTERIAHYSHLNLQPIKLLLPKHEDINSLWVKQEIQSIENLI